MNLSLDDNYEESLSIDKDEYIKSLEISIQLLQREIDTLRKKILDLSSNELQSTIQNIYFSFSNDLINKSNNRNELLKVLEDILSHNKIILEWQLYFINDESSFELVDNSNKNEKMSEELNELVEDGVSDWILSDNEVKFAPSLIDSTDLNTIYNMFVPIQSKGSKSILFFGKTIEDINSLNDDFKSNIKQIINAIALKIDNIISTEHISDITKQLEFNLVSRNNSNNMLLNIALSELEQPIDIISANLGFIENGIGDFKRRTEIIKENVETLKILKNKIININNDTKSQVVEFSIKSLIDEICFLTKNQLQRDGIILKINSNDDVLIKNNKKEIESLFTYLILFSVDIMPEGGILVLSYELKKSNISFKFYFENALLTFEEFENTLSGNQPESLNNKVYKILTKLISIAKSNNFEFDLLNDTKIGTTFSLNINLK